MEPKNPRRIEKDYEEPPYRRFKIILLVSMAFIPVYAGILIWRNYYGPNAKPLERKQAPAPYYNTEPLSDTITGAK